MNITADETIFQDFLKANLLTETAELSNGKKRWGTKIIGLLNHLKNRLQAPVTFTDANGKVVVTTDPDFQNFSILNKQRAPLKPGKAILTGYVQEVRYHTQQPEKSFPLLLLEIPSLDNEEYKLVIHQLDKRFSEADFLEMERALALLQIELLKYFAAHQERCAHLNEAASDLLHDRLDSQDEIDETIYQLGLDMQRRYRVILFRFEGSEEEMSYAHPLHNRLIHTFINYSKLEFPECFYITRRQKFILITPCSREDSLKAKQRVQKILARIAEDKEYANYIIQGSISNEGWLSDLPQAYRQVMDTQKVLRLMGTPYAAATYQDLGIYQIFAETSNLHEVERFIPSTIWILKEQNPDLLETLDAFIQTNQNFSETATRLFVHPKTVHYRVDKLRDSYQVDLQNFEEVMRYGIGLRLLKLLPPDYQGPFQLQKKRKTKKNHSSFSKMVDFY